jgi:hypothetical protein
MLKYYLESFLIDTPITKTATPITKTEVNLTPHIKHKKRETNLIDPLHIKHFISAHFLYEL